MGICNRNPMIACNVGSRDYAILFDEFGKFFRRAFERHTEIGLIQAGDAKHLPADARTKVVVPFYIFRGVRKGKTNFTELFDVHLNSVSPSASAES